MVDPNPNQDNGVLISLSPETLDRLADLVVAPLDYYLHNSKFIDMVSGKYHWWLQNICILLSIKGSLQVRYGKF
jgi:hypothetical protein